MTNKYLMFNIAFALSIGVNANTHEYIAYDYKQGNIKRMVIKEVIQVSPTKPTINLLEGMTSLDKLLVRYDVLDKLDRWADRNNINGYYRIHAYDGRSGIVNKFGKYPDKVKGELLSSMISQSDLDDEINNNDGGFEFSYAQLVVPGYNPNFFDGMMGNCSSAGTTITCTYYEKDREALNDMALKYENTGNFNSFTITRIKKGALKKWKKKYKPASRIDYTFNLTYTFHYTH